MPHKPEDVDGSAKAYHHTLGPRRNQATPGNHRHKKGTIKEGYTSALLFDGDAPADIEELIEILEEYGLDGSVFVPPSGGGGGGVTDHGALTGLGDNDHPQYALDGHTHSVTNWSRTTDTITTGTLASMDNENGTHDFADGFRLLAIDVDRACRVRLYKDSGSRAADLDRPVGTDVDIATDHGLIFEYVATSSIAAMLSPLVDGYTQAGSTIYYAIQNRSGSSSAVAVEFDWIQTE